MKSFNFKYIIILLFSLTLILASLYVSQKSSSINKLVSFGYPLGFVQQDFTAYDPHLYYQAFSLKRVDAQTTILWGNFFISWLTTFLLLVLGIYILEIVDFQTRKLLVRIIDNYKGRKLKP